MLSTDGCPSADGPRDLLLGLLFGLLLLMYCTNTGENLVPESKHCAFHRPTNIFPGKHFGKVSERDIAMERELRETCESCVKNE